MHRYKVLVVCVLFCCVHISLFALSNVGVNESVALPNTNSYVAVPMQGENVFVNPTHGMSLPHRYSSSAVQSSSFSAKGISGVRGEVVTTRRSAGVVSSYGGGTGAAVGGAVVRGNVGWQESVQIGQVSLPTIDWRSRRGARYSDMGQSADETLQRFAPGGGGIGDGNGDSGNTSTVNQPLADGLWILLLCGLLFGVSIHRRMKCLHRCR